MPLLRSFARTAAHLTAFSFVLLACSPPPCQGFQCGNDGGDVADSNDGSETGPTDAPPDAPPTDVPSDGGPITSLAIEPPNPVIVSEDGVGATQAFHIVGVTASGSHVPLAESATWSLEHPNVGAITVDGRFTANGVAGGTVRLDADAVIDGTILHANTTITSRITWTFVAPGLTRASAESKFTTAPVTDPSRAATIVYPLANAVMPNNVSPPDVQWDGGSVSDVIRMRVSRANAEVTAYLVHTSSFGRDFAIPSDAWRALAETDPGTPLRFTVDRFDNARHDVVAGSAPVDIQLASGSTYGAVYYWEVQAMDEVGSRMARIRPDAAARELIIPTPPSPTDSTRQCIGCHAISRDGRFLAAGVGIRNATVFDLTADLSTNPAPTVFPLDRVNFGSSSFSPDNSRLVIGVYEGGIIPSLDRNYLALADPLTGSIVESTGLPSSNAGGPSWSPDGHAIAYIANGVDSPFGTALGDLALLPRITGDTFGEPTIVHHGADLESAPERGTADARASWAPDSRLIAFQHGPSSISSQGEGNNPGAIYVMGPTDTTPVRLDHAMGGASATNAYWPTFSPFTTGEPTGERFYWLAFYSLRDYGNDRVGTRGTQRRQLWVTAIDTHAPAGTDPSHVAYWLPGQDTSRGNMAAYWTALACRNSGESCTVSSECCSGSCRADPSDPSTFTCQPPPPAECRQRGQTCETTSDCCEGSGLECNNHVCDQPLPG